jgi:hypothetical protein
MTVRRALIWFIKRNRFLPAEQWLMDMDSGSSLLAVSAAMQYALEKLHQLC